MGQDREKTTIRVINPRKEESFFFLIFFFQKKKKESTYLKLNSPKVGTRRKLH